MEAMLKPSLIFDLILLAVLLVSAMASYRKGLLTAIVQFAGRLFSLAGAWFVRGASRISSIAKNP